MIRVLLAVLALVALAPATALASVASEQRAGGSLARELRAGQRSCASLSREDLDHVGEFVMGQMLGSTAVHEAMNARMTRTMGAPAEARMHRVLGARYAGCTTSGAAAPLATGPTRMMGQYGTSGWNAHDAGLVVLAIILGAGLVGALFAWRPWRRPTPPAAR